MQNMATTQCTPGGKHLTDLPPATPTTAGVPPVILVGGAFTLNELQALRLRGALREVLPGAYVSTVYPDVPLTRAQVAACVAGKQLVPSRALCKGTAAWILGCAPMPREIDIMVPRYHRPCAPTAGMVLRLSEGPLDDEQICLYGNVPVTSPLRTAMDVAFNSELRESLPILAAINASAHLRCDYGQMFITIAQQARRPGRRRALLAITKLMSAELADID
jgi:hypothetical protein